MQREAVLWGIVRKEELVFGQASTGETRASEASFH